jgi:Flp pilus assembly protein TadG
MNRIAASLVAIRIRLEFARFQREERGAMAFFMLFVFLMMLMFGGIAVDVMRFETSRVAMQQTMDRAALAAASLKQGLDPTSVVMDYFDKADIPNDTAMVSMTLPSVTVSGTANFRTVTATASVKSNNYFMHLLNVDYLEGPTASKAEQGVSKVEIILVVDISGSMNDNGKIGGLKTAATNFVNTVKANDSLNQVSIGIVPYNAQVNLGPLLRAEYNETHVPMNSAGVVEAVPNVNCLQLPTTIFDTTAIPTTLALPMASHADTVSGTTGSGTGYTAWSGSSGGFVFNFSNPCNATTTGVVLMPTKDKAPVLGHISNLVAGGNTSIFLGMRWGVALIDDSAKPIYKKIGSASVSDRPASNSDPLTRKVIVLMTDGDHVSTNLVPDAYKTGLSNVWRSTADSNYSARFTTGRPSCAGTNEYWVPHKWAATPTGNKIAALNQPCGGAWRATAWISETGTGGTAVRQDWSQIWAVARVTWVARHLFGNSGVSGMGYSTMLAAFRTQNMPDTTMDSLLSTNCGAARLAGVEVYGIAFNAPAQGAAAISDCASEPKGSYYFLSTSNAALNDAFQKIAANISELRLTQ